jgi:hypothetical protein
VRSTAGMVAYSGATLSSSDGESTAGDPKSLAAVFWQRLSEGRIGVAEEVARRINPPPITAFSFDDEGGEGGERGASDSSVAANTPSAVTDAWNSPKQVHVMMVDGDNWCLAPLNPGGAADFKACTLGRYGTAGAEGCVKATHMDTPGKTPVGRMTVSDPLG